MANANISADGVLIDSDVLIWFTRGHAKAIAALEAITDWHISAVSYVELAQGCRNKTELKTLQKAFKSGSNEVLPITQEISDMACLLVEKYSLSHSVHLADALIAATAVRYSLPLWTGNSKQFSAVSELKVRVFKP